LLQSEGMTQTRGSNCSEQDKFRITLDCEQVCYGFFDEDRVPKADIGLYSVIFTGKHFRLNNVSKDRRYLEDDRYIVDGVEKICKKGELVADGLGKSLMDFRDNNHQLYEAMYELGFRFYQQPAGFEDSVITVWKIKEQADKYGQTICLRDLFGGALSESSRDQMFLHSQLPSWIRSKITAICQVADTHVIRPTKIRKLQKDVALRRQLIKLSEVESTGVVFKCGMYEICKTLYDVVSELQAEWLPTQYILRAMYQNGWLSMRPSLSKKCLVRTDSQEWTQGFKFGSHRIQKSWSDMRFDHINEKGEAVIGDQLALYAGQTDDTEQSYNVEPGTKRTLECWQQMLKAGDLDPKQIEEFSDEPWFEMEVTSFQNIEGLEEYRELMKTPMQKRQELGIDVSLPFVLGYPMESQTGYIQIQIHS